MSYIEDNLNGENVIMIKKSKMQLFWVWLVGVLFFWFLFIPIIKAIKKTLQFVTTEYAITEKKLIEKRGIIRVVYYEMKLDKVENITISQTFFGRLCDYGNLCIQGANFNNIYFEYVDDPNSVKQQINALIDGSEDNN